MRIGSTIRTTFRPSANQATAAILTVIVIIFIHHPHSFSRQKTINYRHKMPCNKLPDSRIAVKVNDACIDRKQHSILCELTAKISISSIECFTGLTGSYSCIHDKLL